MAKTPALTQTQNQPTPLAAVQSEFRLIKLSGEIRVIAAAELVHCQSGGKQHSINFYKKHDAELLIKRYLEALPVPSDPKKVIADFWVNPNTFVYDSVAFSPLPTAATTLNYWTDYTAAPKPGNWSRIRGFLLRIICDGDYAVFTYLLCYLAHMLQNPGKKPGIMIVMLGAQGTGKGTLFTLIRRIWAKTTLQVSDVEQVIGRFNASLEHNYAILMDEALFSGDKKAIEKLKSLITEPQIGIEQKYQPSRTIDSYHRFFAASNNRHFARIDRDDRRFLFLRVSSERQGDSEYFKSLFDTIHDDSVIGAMVYELLQLDLSSYDVRLRPTTKEHLKQKIQSLSGFDRHWYEILATGTIPNAPSEPQPWRSTIFITTDQLENGYKTYDKNAERYQPIQTQTIADRLRELCPSAEQCRPTVNGKQKRGYQLPSLEVARKEFEAAVRSKVDWGWEATSKNEPEKYQLSDYDLEAMREAYEMDDGAAVPDEELV